MRSSHSTPAAPSDSVSAMMCAWLTAHEVARAEIATDLDLVFDRPLCRRAELAGPQRFFLVGQLHFIRRYGPRGLNQRHPLVDLASNQISKCLRRALPGSGQIGAQIRQPLGDGLVAHGFVDRRIDALDDRLRRRPWEEQGRPRDGLQRGQARLGRGGHFGNGGGPARRRDRDRLHAARQDVRSCGDDLIEHQVDLPGQEIIHGLRKAAVGHVLDFRLGEVSEQEIGEMRDRAGAGAAEGELVWVCLRHSR